MNLKNGGIRIFRLWGINVYLHWSWLIAAYFLINWGSHLYTSPVWNVVEYAALFLIVLLHEFGHAMACRSVGGTAERIILWPLGGVAYVDPPPRPGPMLWSIAAGPLVNMLLVPVIYGIGYLISVGTLHASPDVATLVEQLGWINFGLLIFNLFPAYPLDGGKILWSILWFFMGRWHSLMVATIIGLIAAVGGIIFAVSRGNNWLVYVALYAAFLSWNGFQQALKMIKLNSGPKHTAYACPSCHAHPPMTALWRCSCGSVFDTFASEGRCPGCSVAFNDAQCTSCGKRHPIADWVVPAFPVVAAAAHPGVVPPPIPVSGINSIYLKQ